jgi:hypothetical protein
VYEMGGRRLLQLDRSGMQGLHIQVRERGEGGAAGVEGTKGRGLGGSGHVRDGALIATGVIWVWG